MPDAHQIARYLCPVIIVANVRLILGLSSSLGFSRARNSEAYLVSENQRITPYQHKLYDEVSGSAKALWHIDG